MCVCLPPAVECSETVCGPVLDSSQLSKKICLRLQGKSGVRTGTRVRGVERPLTCCFCQKRLMKTEISYRKEGAVRMGGALGGKGKGLCFFPSL